MQTKSAFELSFHDRLNLAVEAARKNVRQTIEQATGRAMFVVHALAFEAATQADCVDEWRTAMGKQWDSIESEIFEFQYRESSSFLENQDSAELLVASSGSQFTEDGKEHWFNLVYQPTSWAYVLQQCNEGGVTSSQFFGRDFAAAKAALDECVYGPKETDTDTDTSKLNASPSHSEKVVVGAVVTALRAPAPAKCEPRAKFKLKTIAIACRNLIADLSVPYGPVTALG